MSVTRMVTKADLAEQAFELGAMESRSRLTRMRKAALASLVDRLSELEEITLSADEFIEKAQAKSLDSYWGAGYWPSWLAPNGKIVVGNNHSKIASTLKRVHGMTEAGTYSPLARRGFIRLVPSSDLKAFSIDMGVAKVNEAQIETLRKVLPHWSITGGNFDRSYVNNKPVTSVEEALAALAATSEQIAA